jgi:NADH:ubiquinone oxidoreductase subunit 5 (subunit L)/multisubunit Na+/H+ antiporter MnhA subunit
MTAGGIAAAASGAASGARTSGFNFDPVAALPWAVPLILVAPLLALLLAVSSVRTRRSAASMAMFGALVMLVVTLLVGWALIKKNAPFLASYTYINLPVAFNGPSNFQNFAMNLTLRVGPITVAALLVIEICFIAVAGWHQVMGRSEPGAARFYALLSGLLFASAGVLVSLDLAELLAFWGLASGITYLLLGHRWGLDEAARRARVALALPFLTDLSLLCGVAWLYSRYGAQNLQSLVPNLHNNPGWTVRSLVVASILLLIGVAGRLALWPFQSWITRTVVSAPPAASAITQVIWSVLAIVVLYRFMPIVAASNQQTIQACMYACAGSAVVSSLLALLGNEPRRVIALLGSSVAAVGAAIVIHGFEDPRFTFGIAGVACVLAAAPVRASAVLAINAIAGAMRTDDMAEMGDALRRMRRSSIALLASVLVLGLSAAGALAYAVSSRSWLGVALGEAVFVISIGGLRVFYGVSIGPLRRRRAFEPDRVREAPRSALGWPFWLVIAGAVLLGASLVRNWLDFLDGQKHSVPAVGSFALWLAVVVVGFAAVSLVYMRNKDGALAVSSAAGWLVDRISASVAALVDRFFVAPTTDIARRVGDWIPAGDGALGRAAEVTGQVAMATGRLPAVPLVLVLTVVLAVLLALVAPGVWR